MKKKCYQLFFLARVLSTTKNIDNITKNKWSKFERPVSYILDFIQTYVALNTENHKLWKMEFKVKSCSEALIFIIKTPLLHTWFLLQKCFYTNFHIIQKYL